MVADMQTGEVPLQPETGANIADFNAFTGSIGQTQAYQTQYDAEVAQREADVAKQQGNLNKLTESFNLPSAYAKLQKQQGIPDITKQLQEANLQLTQMQSQYQMTNQELAQQTIPEAFVIGQQNELAKTASIRIGAQAAYVQALQGNLELANHYVDKMIDLQAQDYEAKYTAQSNNLNIAMKFLDTSYQKQAQQVQFKMDLQKADYSNMLDVKKASMQNALLNGAPAGVIQAISVAKTSDEVYSAAGRYAVDPMAQAQLRTEQLQQAKLLQDLEEGKQSTPEVQVAKTISNVQQLEGLASQGGMSSAVGTSILTRKPGGFWGTVGKAATIVGIPGLVKDAYNKLTGKAQNFIADVEQVRSQLNLDTLINAKANGATFGALSNEELNMLSQAGTKLGKWAIKDKQGNVVGYNASEKDFQKEINQIANFTKLDALLKGADPASINVQVTPDGAYWSQNPDGTLTRIR